MHERIPNLESVSSALDEATRRLVRIARMDEPDAGETVHLFELTTAELRRAREVYGRAPLALFLLAPDGEVLDCNEAFARLLGYPERERLLAEGGFSERHAFGPLERIELTPGLEMPGVAAAREVRLRRLDGAPLWLAGELVRTRSGFVEGVAVDVSERKHAEERLRRSEEIRRRILEMPWEGFLLLDGKQVVVDVNDSLCRMTGHAREDLIGVPPLRVAGTALREYLLDVARRPNAPDYKAFEDGILCRKKTELRVLVHANTLRDPWGRISGTAVFVSDQTARRRSLVMAEEVQRSMLPDENLAAEGLEVAWRYAPLEEIGGDYLDILVEDDFCGRGVGVVVGDITGHGVNAALLMATARAFFRMRATCPGSLAALVGEMNTHLTDDTARINMFMSLFLLGVDRERRELRWVRAGHEPAFLYDPSQDRFEELNAPGMLLGINHRTQFEEGVRQGFQAGQIVVMASDGIWEAASPLKERFGMERLRQIIRGNARSSAADMVKAVFASLDRFTLGHEPEDDRTLVVLKFTE